MMYYRVICGAIGTFSKDEVVTEDMIVDANGELADWLNIGAIVPEPDPTREAIAAATEKAVQVAATHEQWVKNKLDNERRLASQGLL